MGDRILLRGGHVVTMDQGLGEIAGGDVLIDGSKIAEVAQHIEVEDVETVYDRLRKSYPTVKWLKRPSNRPFAGISTHDPDGNVFRSVKLTPGMTSVMVLLDSVI